MFLGQQEKLSQSCIYRSRGNTNSEMLATHCKSSLLHSMQCKWSLFWEFQSVWNPEWNLKWHTNEQDRIYIYIWSNWHPGNPGAVGVPCRDSGRKNQIWDTTGVFFQKLKYYFKFSRLTWYSKVSPKLFEMLHHLPFSLSFTKIFWPLRGSLLFPWPRTEGA